MQRPDRIGSNTVSCFEKKKKKKTGYHSHTVPFFKNFFYKKVKRENVGSKEVLQHMIWASVADYYTQLSQMIIE